MQNNKITTLSSKGQIVIPGDVRKKLGAQTGTKFFVITDGKTLILEPIVIPKADKFKDLLEKSKNFANKKNLKRTGLVKLIRKIRNEGSA